MISFTCAIFDIRGFTTIKDFEIYPMFLLVYGYFASKSRGLAMRLGEGDGVSGRCIAFNRLNLFQCRP
jgi:hypothetical protein